MVVQHEKLSVILPVSNAQHEVADRIESLLDDLMELHRSVQIVVCDDGTTDATAEVLDELRLSYPQVTGVRSPRRLGAAKVVEIGLSKASGDFIFLHESYEPVDTEALARLWSLRHDDDLVVARASTRTKSVEKSLIDKLATWGRSLEDHWKKETKSLDTQPLQPGLQMMRRSAIDLVARIDPKQHDFEVAHLSHRRLTTPSARRHINRSTSK